MTAELSTTAGSDVKGARLGRPVNSPGGDELGLVDTADQLPAMISWWDGEERNRFANRSALQWFGLPPPARSTGCTCKACSGRPVTR